MVEHGFFTYGSEQGQVSGCCEHGICFHKMRGISWLAELMLVS